MQFKHPELLYALFLLIIPIIVHLFQLRKFQKEAFTNVAFLKEVTMQTRKSSQLKKWLTLITRLLLLAAIIFAFAQPFTSKSKTFNTTKETVVYLDNSFSMQAKGNRGELLKRAVQDLISYVPENDPITLITNDETYKNTSIKTLSNDLLQLKYSPEKTSYNAMLLKAKKHFSKDKSSNKNLIFISDFQQEDDTFTTPKDSIINLNLVQLKPESINNIAIDSVFISKRTATQIELSVRLINSGDSQENVSVALYDNDILLAKTAINITDEASTLFSLPNNKVILGRIAITDNQLQFDNNFYFNLNKAPKVNVLSITEGNDSFLKRIYTENEFNFTSSALNQLNFNTITAQNLIVLNELNTIPNALTTALKSFTDNGGSLIIIPSNDISLSTYNSLLTTYDFSAFGKKVTTEKRLTTINYSHPLYVNGVFEKRVKNFQYPRVNSFYPQKQSASSKVLEFEDGSAFLSQRNNGFLFNAPLDTKNSNFKNINLIVPTFYNIARFSLKNVKTYYTIGKENVFDVSTILNQDDILTLETGDYKIIPQQIYFNNKVSINTNSTPNRAGIYDIKNKAQIIEQVSYNNNRTESQLIYQNLNNITNANVTNTIEDVFETIKSDTKVNALWKWFVIFALVLLIIEMLILKYFK